MLKQKIIALEENYFKLKRPIKIKIKSINGRIIYSKFPMDLFYKYNKKTEKIATLEEVIHLRIKAFKSLMKNVPELKKVVSNIEKNHNSRNIEKLLNVARTKSIKELEKEIYSIWKIRPTTSVHMVRAIDVDGIDKIFFYNGNPFDNEEDMTKSFTGELSDGGIRYNQKAIRKIIKETPRSCKMSHKDYLSAKGGNFSGIDWLNHPIFSKSIQNKKLFEKYVYSLQVLNLLDFYHQGKHSGWRPGEMKINYGRLISLGYKGEAFYPSNNSTLDHCMIVLAKKI